MATLVKDLELMFENLIEGFDAACVISREAETSYPSAKTMQRAGDVFYKKQNYHVDVVTGLDLGASPLTDVIERMVPTVYRSPDNVQYEFDARELRDEQHMRRTGEAAALRLAAEVDRNIYSACRLNANIVVRKVGAMDWETGALAEAQMISRGITAPQGRSMFLNPFDHLAISGNLAGRAYMGDLSKAAYERSQVPDIAGFRTFRTDSVSNLAAVGTVTGTTVSANPLHTITAMTGDVPTDNRFGSLVVAGANIANIKNGDSFTIANVNAVHMIDKSDTGQPMTFRVISGGGTANLVIGPKIITAGPYQNVSTAAIATAPITFLNTSTRPVNVAFARGAVTLDYGRLEFPSDTGAQVLTANTKQGVPIVMVAQMNARTGKVYTRCTTLYAATCLDPEKVAIVIANQV